MKKIYSLIFMLALLSMSWAVRAQETLTVYDGTATNGYVPVYGFYADAYLKCEFVVPADELAEMTNGTISQMTFYLSSPAAEAWTASFQVFLAEVPDATISSFYGTSEATIVYEGLLDATGSTMTVAFDNNYTYTGGNLLVGFYLTETGNYKSASFYGESINGASVQGYSYSGLDGVSPTQRNFIPKTTFEYTTGGGITCARPTGLIATTTPGQGDIALLSWTDNANASAWQICLNNDESNLIDVTTTSYTLTGLTSDQTYTAKVRAVCSSSDQSTWSSSVTFTPTNSYQIGSGTATSTNLPSYNYYKYGLSQQIYTTDEIGTAGSISSIAFYNGGAEKTRTYDIYLVNTEKTSFSGNTDWIPVTSDDLVFSGEVTMVANQWTTIPFDQDFLYDFSSNLALIVDDNTGDYTNSPHMECRVFTPDVNAQAIYVRSDGTNYDPTNPSSYSGTLSNAKNQIQLGLTPGGSTCPRPTGLTVTLNGLTGTLTWNSTADYFDIELNNLTDGITEQSNMYAGNSFTLDAFLSWGTVYEVKVRAICDDGESNWATYTFHTDMCPAENQCTITLELTDSYGDGWNGNAIQVVDALTGVIYGSYTIEGGSSATHQVSVCDGRDIVFVWVKGTYPGETSWVIYDLNDEEILSGTGNTSMATGDTLEIYTMNCTPTTCRKPSALTVSEIGPHSVVLGWTDNAGASAWQISLNNGINADIIDVTENPYTITGLDAETYYTFSVRANCGDGDLSNWTSSVGFTTDVACPAPTLLTTSDVQPRSAVLGWTDNADATSWQICVDNDEENLIDVTANPYTLTGLDPETSYTVKVRANCGSEGMSAWSSNKSFTTLVACPAPENVTALPIPGNSNGANMSWTQPSDAEAWVVQYSMNASFDNYDEVPVYGLPTVTINGLITDSTYYARVKADCGDVDGESAWSEPVSFIPTEKIQIGAGNSTNSYLPTYNLYNYSLTQQIYTTEELGDAGTITSIDFYKTSNNACNRLLNIYMVSTDKSEFANGTDWISVTPGDLVFSDTVNFINNAWTTITLHDGFEYDGQHNVAIIVDDNTGSWTSSNTFRVFSATKQAIRVYSDGTNYNPFTPSLYSGTVENVKNQIRILMGDAPTCLRPTSLNVDEITAHTAEIEWAQPGNVSAWQICFDGDESNLIDVNDNSYTFTGLAAETEHTVKVRANCGDGMSNWTPTITFTTLEACFTPSNLTYTEVGPRSAELIWTENGEATTWQLCINEDEENLIDVTENPYTLTGLDPETPYLIKVRANCGADGVSNWSNTTAFNTLEPCPTPTDLSAEAGPHDAILTWTGYSDNYNVRYRPAASGQGELLFSDDFEDGLDLSVWTVVDADGDGYNWTGSTDGNLNTHSGDGMVYSQSYINDVGVLTPDNWLISPQVQLGGSVSFWAVGQDASYAAEHFAIYVSTTGTDPSDFTPISEEYVATGDYAQYIASLSNYSGTGYVAIRHYNVTDMYWLNIDDFSVYGPAASETPWTNFNANSNTVTISGLETETSYEVQVRSNCGSDGISDWSSLVFTTTEACPAPTHITADDITSNSATLEWVGFGESYNVQYGSFDMINYDDGEFATSIGSSSGNTFTWATMYPASMLDGNDVLTGVSIFETGYNEDDIIVRIYSGGDDEPSTLLYEENVTPMGDGEFHNVTFATPVTIDPTQNLWISLTEYGTYVMTSCYSTVANNQLVNSGDTWVLIGDLSASLSDYGWMIRAFVGDENSQVTLSNVTSPLTLTDLNPNSTYNVLIQSDCGSEDGISGWAPFSFTTEEAVCPVPTNVAYSNVTKNSAFISWDDSEEAAEWEISINHDEENTIYAASNMFQFNGLTPETEYTIQVRAICGDGSESEWSEEVTFMTSAACPATTDLAVSDITSGSATLTWTGEGTSYALRYALHNSTDWEVMEDVTSPYILEGLEPETEYDVQVMSFCEDYMSLWSNMETFTTLSCPAPSIPTFSNITKNSVVISWTENGSATSWQLLVNNDEENILDVTENPYTLTDLEPEHEYTVQVRSNCVGAVSAWGEMDQFTTDLACKPTTNLAATNVTSNGATLTWTGEGDSYALQYRTTDGEWVEVENVTSPYVFEELLPATAYEVQVQNVCAGIPSDWSNTVTFTTLACPSPSALAVSGITKNSAVLGWVENGSATAWEIALNGDEENIIEANMNPFMLTGLTPGTLYIVQVRANCGADAVSAWVEQTFTTDVACHATTNLTVSDITSSSATLAWNGEGESHNVRYRTTDDEWILVENVYSPYILSGLQPDYSYDVQVQNFCGGEPSEWSNMETFTTLSCPAPTELVINNITKNTAVVSWTENGTATAWQIVLNGDNENIIDVTENPYTLTGLTPNTDYEIQLRANCGGATSELVSGTFVTDIACHATEDLALSNVTSSSVTLTWTGEGDSYTVRYKTADDDWMLAENVTSPYVLTGLQPETEYEIQVQNVCAGIASDWSNMESATTASCVTPTELTVSEIGKTSAVLTWTENGTATAWQIMVNGDEENVIDVTENPYTLTGLTTWTDYTVKVRTNCGTATSAWSDEQTFTTLPCDPQAIPYSYNFEEPAPFDCWRNLEGQAEIWNTTDYTKALALDGINNLVVLPQFEEEISNLQISFWARPHNYDSENLESQDGTLQVGYVTDPNDASTFVAVNTYNTEWTNSALLTSKLETFEEAPAGSHIAFRHNAETDNSTWYVDNVLVSTVCAVPTGITATTTNNSATISWDNSDGVTWEIAFNGSEHSINGTESCTTNQKVYNNLNSEATYYVIVRTNCGDGVVSKWSDKVYFTTGADIIPSYITITGDTAVCEGEVTELTAETDVEATYLWSTGANTQTVTVPAGEYTVTVTSTTQHELSRTVTVTTKEKYAFTHTESICPSELPYEWNGLTFTEADTKTATFVAANGCDSLETLTLNVYPTYSRNIEASICPGASYDFNGTMINTEGVYVDTLQTVNGCDSIITLALTIGDVITTPISASICQGDSYVFFGDTLTEANVYEHSLPSASGCDSVIVLTLTVNELPNVRINGKTDFCEGESSPLTAVGANTFVWNTEATTAAITVSEAGTYTVIGTDANGCQNTAEVTVTVNPLPTVTVSGENVLCEGDSTTLTAEGATTYVWSNEATTESIVVTETGVYTVIGTDANGCQNTAEMTVTVNALPTVTIAGETAFCEGANTTLTAEGAATYVWSNEATTAEITVEAAGTYTVIGTDSNGCQNTAEVTVTVNPLPTVTITGDTEFCEGLYTLLIATGADTYVWSNEDTTAEIAAEAAGTYTVTGTDVNGCQNTASVTVTANPIPTVTITGETVFCEGNTSILTAEGADTYIWSTEDTIAAIEVNTSGDYTVLGIDANGCVNFATVNVTVNPLPTVTIAGETVFCEGDNTTLTAEGAATYVWSTEDTTAAITVEAADTYTVTGTDVNGCVNTTTATVTVNPLPTVTITGASEFCQGSSTVLTAEGASAYIWSNASITPTINVFVAGDYSVLGIDTNGCENTAETTVIMNMPYNTPVTEYICQGDVYDFFGQELSSTGIYYHTLEAANGCDSVIALTLVVNSLPTPVIVGDTVICEGQTTTLTAVGGVSFVWSNDSTQNNIIVNESGLYTVTATAANGCTASTSVNVTVNELPTVTISGIDVFCQGETSTLTASGATTYTWSNNANTADITVNAAGTYTVVGTDDNGCQNTASTTVTVNALPTVTISGETAICEGGSTTLTAAGATDYAWNTEATTAAINVNEAGIYTVTGTDVNGCQNTAEVTVVVNTLPTVAITGETAFCEDGSTTLTAEGAATYVWSNEATTASITVNAAGTYTVIGIDVNGCQNTATTTVTVNALPAVAVTADNLAFCQGQNTTLTATGANTYVWSNSATTDAITVTTAGTYTVIGTDVNGCQNTASATVTVNPLPMVTISGESDFCAGGSTTVTAGGAATYAWNNGVTTAALTVTAPGTYTVTGTNANGCSSTADITVAEHALPTVAINGETSFCEGASTTLTATGASTYVWSTAAAIPTINVTTAGAYTVTGTDTYGCQNTASVTVITNPTPTVTISGNNTICQGSSTTLTAAGATTYAWSTAATTAAINVDAAGTYTVTGTNANGCSNTASVTVTVNMPTTSTDVQVACDSYTWIDGNTYTSSTNTPTFTLTNAAGCDSVITLNLTINNSVTTEFTIETSDSCYVWNGQTYCQSGDYTQTLETATGCDSVVTLHLTTSVGVEDYEATMIFLAPNPTKNICRIKGVDGENVTVDLFDMRGKLVMRSNNTELDVANLPTGFYMVKVDTGKRIVNLKLIKQ